MRTPPGFPRSAGYDLDWQLEGTMGPNVLWLAEALTQVLPIHPNERVLDLGCGKALSSIFLAREFWAQVTAADLWTPEEDNQRRIDEAGVADRVTPVRAEAHALPFGDAEFDVVISLDAYHYFGTDDLYIGTVHRLLKPGGRFGIVVPGLKTDVTSEGIPAHLQPYWHWDFVSFHSPDWWLRHWQKTGLLEVELADWVDDGWRHWLAWMEICADRGQTGAAAERDMLVKDAGRTLGFARVVGRRPPAP
jgi:cyclopropane fatty-acyl-phospholipid synthase-like methyltransferase